MRTGRKFTLVNRYIGFEYIVSFLVSFLFFFFIFFINQILVFAQKIMLKNVHIHDILLLVILSIPQFLMYTMPFSSLASASMVIGNFSSQNEILAMRASGIDLKRIFMPIVFISVIFSIITLMIANYMIPYTANEYKELYAKILKDIPTLELNSYSSTQFGNRIISNGLVKDNIIHDVLIFDNSDSSNSKVITASEASISVVDLDRFIYRIDLENPEILVTDETSLETYSLAQASDLSLFINLNNSSSGYTTLTPSQMGLSQLAVQIEERKQEQDSLIISNENSIAASYNKLGSALYDVENINNNSEKSGYNIQSLISRINRQKDTNNYSFYYQYYKSEYNKKIALSFACTCLVFLAFPISFFKIKYGKLVGFGLSMMLACVYWFFIYFMHVKAVNSAINPFVLLWMPNFVVLIGGLLLIRRLKKN